ncbi:hypothetical protein D3C71_21450 [compost metagenome]
MQPDSVQKRRVVKARADMLADQPFFGFTALRLKVVDDPSCAGIWTDAVTLGFNPAYIDTLMDIELKGLISDAVMRIVAGHPWRQDGREAVRWNEACSKVTHLLVHEAGFRLPKGMEPDASFKGMSAEFIYTKLPATASPPPAAPKPEPSKGGEEGEQEGPSAAGGGDGEPEGESSKDEGGDAKPGEGGPGDKPELPSHMLSEVRQAPKDQESLEDEWKVALEAATHMQGDLPGNLLAVVGNTLKSKVDWRSVLQNFAEASMQAPDYSMRVVNRRYLHLGFILPGLQGSSMRSIVVVRDTSGSIGRQYRELFNGELLDIVERMKPEALYVLDVDTHIRKVQTMLEGDEEDFDPNMHGGGGTSFCEPFRWVEEEGIDCACVVYLTDLQGRFPDQEPDYPVLWAVPEGSNRGQQPPFGELVELEL